MGGGDLNLKKSWHPSTLRNVERVWKAEQQHEAEKKKIQELQKEIAEERALQEMRQYAEDQGVVKKKSDRLDWMYKGPGTLRNNEDYLLGKPVDKAFETALVGDIKSSSAYESVPESIFSSTVDTIQVDLAAKLREDPLYSIRKEEEESRKLLLSNPVKLKRLKEFQAAQEKSLKKHKKHKKNKHKHASTSSDSDETDKKIRKLYKQQRAYMQSKEETHKKKHKSKKHKRKQENSSSEGDDRSRKRQHSPVNGHKHFEENDRNRKRQHSPVNGSGKHKERDYIDSGNSKVSYDTSYYGLQKDMKIPKHSDASSKLDRSHRDPKEKSSRKKDRSPTSQRKERSPDNLKASVKPQRDKTLDKDEKKRRLEEMMENAKWRDEQRSTTVKKLNKEEQEELNKQFGKGNPDFIGPMLSNIAEKGSVESRIKSNIYNIQRTKRDLDGNFLKR